MKMNIRQQIAEWLGMTLGVNEITEDMVGIPPDRSLGDYAFPCFRLSRVLKKSPQAIAQSLALAEKLPLIFTKVEAVSGYLNFFVDQAQLAEIVLSETLQPSPSVRNGQTIVIEYSSPNIAKPFHIGHLCSTVIGDSLAKVYDCLGWNVRRINHLGDYGTQFGKLISAYSRWGEEEALQKEPIAELFRIYVKFHEQVQRQPELEEEARRYFKNLEDGNPEETALWQRFKEMSLKKFSEIYNRLHVQFDSWAGESFYSDKMEAVVKELRAKGLLTISEGAEIVDLSDNNLPPCLIMKSDGASLYATRDLAAAIYRAKTYKFNACLYVVGLPQTLHFEQVFAVLKKMGYRWSDQCGHVGFAHVKFKDGQMSTRTGHVIFLEDVLDEAVKRAKARIMESCLQPESIDETAEKVGIGAVKFAFLKAGREREILFDWDEVLDFNGDSGPYVQYTYARAASILRKADKSLPDIPSIHEVNEEEAALINHLNGFGNMLLETAKRNDPCIVTRYVLLLARLYNRFYSAYPVLGSDKEPFRLALTRAVSIRIQTCLSLLGIDCVEKM
jgi:arginyl-tRNA synthetase